MKNKQLLVISSYPERGFIHGQKTVGNASYTKNTLLALKKQNKDLKITVLGEILDQPEDYLEKDILVKRTWKRDNLLNIFKLFRLAQKEKTENIMIAFEAYMFGGLGKLLLFPLLLFSLKLAGKKVHLVLHQVIGDFRQLEKNGLKARFLNLVKSWFYQLVVYFSYRTIVFEEELKRVLGDREKIKVIPHAVEKLNNLSKSQARKKLGLANNEFYALFFGYLSPYKGADFLVDSWKKIEGTKLILAGGANPNHIHEPEYAHFVNNIFQKAKAINPKIIAPGFIPEKEIPLYFSAADLFILPYRAFISSSGPLSMAFAYQKPVLFSHSLSGYLKSPDIKRSLEKSGLKQTDLLFKLEGKNLMEKLFWIKKGNNLNKSKRFSSLIKEKRSWEKVSRKYIALLEEN